MLPSYRLNGTSPNVAISSVPTSCIHFACNRAAVAGIFACFQPNLKRGDGLVKPSGCRIENNSRSAQTIVQSFVSENKPVLSNLRFQATAATFSVHPAQLENIREISIEFDCERNIDGCASVVMDSKPFVTRFFPENLRAKHV